MKNKLNNTNVHKNYRQITMHTGYTIKDDFAGLAVNFYQLIFSLVIATILLAITFLWQPLNFWLCITISTLILGIMGYVLGGNVIERHHISLEAFFWGILSAVLLYGIFFLGSLLIGLPALELFNLPQYVQSIYDWQYGISPILLILALLLVTSPCEEIFWRGFIQRGLSQRFGETAGWILAAILYAAIHMVSLNPILVLTAFFAGLLWGYMYRRQRHIVSCIASHALWALAVFIFFPLI